jgi:hypothetical protein
MKHLKLDPDRFSFIVYKTMSLKKINLLCFSHKRRIQSLVFPSLNRQYLIRLGFIKKKHKEKVYCYIFNIQCCQIHTFSREFT